MNDARDLVVHAFITNQYWRISLNTVSLIRLLLVARRGCVQQVKGG